MRSIPTITIVASTLGLLLACTPDEEGRRKRGRGDDGATTQSWSTTDADSSTWTTTGDDDDDDATDGTADLVFVNDSDWMAFDSLTLWECSENLAYTYFFEIDDWLDPGEAWTLTGVPTDICFRPELWNGPVNYGVEWSGRRFDTGENRLVIQD